MEASGPSDSGPKVDTERLEAVYLTLGGMTVELDADPLELGPKRLNEKIAECRGHLSRCEKVFLDVSQDLHWYKRQQRYATAAFTLKFRELMTNDPEVRAGRSVADRDATANTKLKVEREELDKLSFSVEDLEAVLIVIRTKRSDLKDIQSRLRDQLKVCQEELGLGGRWGNSLPGKKRGALETARVVSETLDPSIGDLMDSVFAESDPAPGDVQELQGASSYEDQLLSEIDGSETTIGVPTQNDDIDEILSLL